MSNVKDQKDKPVQGNRHAGLPGLHACTVVGAVPNMFQLANGKLKCTTCPPVSCLQSGYSCACERVKHSTVEIETVTDCYISTQKCLACEIVTECYIRTSDWPALACIVVTVRNILHHKVVVSNSRWRREVVYITALRRWKVGMQLLEAITQRSMEDNKCKQVYAVVPSRGEGMGCTG